MPENNDQIKSRRFKLIQFGVIIFLYWAALYIYVPTLPVYTQSILNDLVLVGTVLGMYGLGQALVRLPVGIIADWRGWHRQLTVVCIAMVGGGALIMAFGTSMAMLTIARLITGFGAATWVLLMVAFSSLFKPNEAVRAVAIMSFINTTGRFTATLLTGFLNDLGGFRLPFFLSAILAAIAIVLFLSASAEKQKKEPVSLKSISRLIVREDVFLPAVINIFTHIVDFAATFSFLPLLARSLGATNVQISIMTSMSMAIWSLFSLLVSWLSKRFSSTHLVYVGLLFSTVGLFLAAMADSLVWIFIAQAFIGMAMGITYPCLAGMSILYVKENERSTAMGLHQAVYSIGMFAGPWLGGILADRFGIQSMFIIIALGCSIFGMIINRRYQIVCKKQYNCHE